MGSHVFLVDNLSNTGRKVRQALSVLHSGATAARPLGGRSGVRPGSNTFVTVSGMTWTVGPHAGCLDVEGANEASVYDYAFDAPVAGGANSINAADGTNPRVDSLFVQLSDPTESDGTSSPGVSIIYAAGAPGATGGARGAAGGPPPYPARSMELAQITVPKVGGGSPSVVMTHPFATAAGADYLVRSQAERDALVTNGFAYPGCTVKRLDVGNVRQTYNGSIWETQAGPVSVGIKTANGNVSNNVSTDVTWDTMKHRRGASGGVVTWTPGLAGYYRLSGFMSWTAASGGVRAVQVIVDGNATPVGRVDADGTNSATIKAGLDYPFSIPFLLPTDTSTVKVQVSYWDSSPSTLQLLAGSSMTLEFVADQ